MLKNSCRLLRSSSKITENQLQISKYVSGSQFGQPILVQKILNLNKSSGFFIEAGAADGELISNTLHLELNYNWTGLLVEPNPTFLKALLSKQRNAYILPHCLSTKPFVETVNFDVSEFVSGIYLKDKIKPSRIDNPDPDRANLIYERQTQVQQCIFV